MGHLTTEIWVILEVHPLELSAIFHSFLLFSLKFMNMHDKKFHIIPYGKSKMSKH